MMRIAKLYAQGFVQVGHTAEEFLSVEKGFEIWAETTPAEGVWVKGRGLTLFVGPGAIRTAIPIGEDAPESPSELAKKKLRQKKDDSGASAA